MVLEKPTSGERTESSRDNTQIYVYIQDFNAPTCEYKGPSMCHGVLHQIQ